jgi:hypothetical protein
MVTAQTIQADQLDLLPGVYAGEPLALVQYEATVLLLKQMLGEDAHVAYLDAELYQSYSDCWKDEYDYRPRHHVTIADARAFLARFWVPESVAV